VTALHQFVPTFDPGAVGTHIVEIQKAMRELGWESEVFSEHTKAPYDGCAHKYTDYSASGPDEILLYHAAIGSTVADWLMAEHRRRLVVDYHNITPPSWFDGWEPPVAYGLGWGRAQLRRLSRRSRFGLADSAFNAAELARVGFRQTAVLPILLPAVGGEPSPSLVAQLRSRPGGRWVFVGRLAPNKRQHLLVAALAAYRRAFDPDATLTLVGGASSDSYEAAVRSYVADLGLEGAVTITGAVSDADRDAYYAAADAFVCTSAHEGFLVPLLEAWHHRVPVIAVSAAAVPETLGDAGLLLPNPSPTLVATAVARVVQDRSLADRLRVAGDRRLAVFAPSQTRARLYELASSLLSEMG